MFLAALALQQHQKQLALATRAQTKPKWRQVEAIPPRRQSLRRHLAQVRAQRYEE